MTATVLYCPVCSVEILRYRLSESGCYVEHEAACVSHMESQHPIRYRLWKRLGWRWLLR